MNPIFIPKNFREVKENGEKILYCNQLIDGKDLRVIEYYDEKSSLYRVNVWGICGKLEKSGDNFVAFDKNINLKTMRGLKKPLEKIYSKEIELAFF